MSAEEDPNPYELLAVGLESTEQEIKTAYRQRSLKVHPDRNRGNPDAARKFHELNQGYELLLDPLRRMALDAKLRLKEAKKARFANYDNKRKVMVEELEERERALKRTRTEKEEKKREMYRENERIMEEGRIMREEREKELAKRQQRQAEAKEATEFEPPALGSLDTTVRLKYTLASHPELTTSETINALLAPLGATDTADILLSFKPPPPKKAKRAIVLVPFKQIGDAFGAVCASGREESGLKDIEVSWGEGREPPLIEWLKKMGQLGSKAEKKKGAESTGKEPKGASVNNVSSGSSPFSTFPSTFPELQDPLSSSSGPSNVAGLDYEALTMMRLRQAERERLEREIREQEELEG